MWVWQDSPTDSLKSKANWELINSVIKFLDAYDADIDSGKGAIDIINMAKVAISANAILTKATIVAQEKIDKLSV